MTKHTLCLILCSVLLTSLAQVSLKAGMSSPSVLNALASELRLSHLVAIFGHPLVIVGLTMYVISTFIWMIVLSKTDVGLAYPFVSLGFVVTMVLGSMLYGEVITATRIAGALIIFAGVVVLAQG
jgi:drug/metabolite transporter (DMT)-like permease